MLAGLTGLEPATSGVTGRRSNQLSYNPASTAKAILQKLAPFVKKEVKKTCGYGPRGQRPAYHQSDYASVVGVTPSLGRRRLRFKIVEAVIFGMVGIVDLDVRVIAVVVYAA